LGCDPGNPKDICQRERYVLTAITAVPSRQQ
jgi:hypothetical protein